MTAAPGPRQPDGVVPVWPNDRDWVLDDEVTCMYCQRYKNRKVCRCGDPNPPTFPAAPSAQPDEDACGQEPLCTVRTPHHTHVDEDGRAWCCQRNPYTPAQPDEVPDGSWITEEFERAKARWAELPVWARPVITRPAAPSAQPDEVEQPCPSCGHAGPIRWNGGWATCRDCGCTAHAPAQPVRDTEEGRR